MKTIIATLALVLSFQANAQMNAKDGIAKLKSNIDSSKVNLAETQNALKAYNDNVAQVAKAKNISEGQKTEIKKAIQENDKYLVTLSKHETDLNKLITDEKKDKDSEAKKLADLEKAVFTLKTNQARRTANVQSYEDQLKQIQKERAEWKARGDEMQKSSVSIDKQFDTIAVTEGTWKEKQKKAQADVKDWQMKTDRNTKLHEQMVTISDIKE